MDFPDQLTLLSGNNAQGKTSVLEAIHFLSILTSPLASNDREAIHILSLQDEIPIARLVAQFQKGDAMHNIEIRLILNGSQLTRSRLRKEVLLDGVKWRLFDGVGFFNSVLFLPQMMRILEDGPEERRKYLDQLLSQACPGYVHTLSNYQQALTRRNALLKQLNEHGGDQAQLTYWDDLLSTHGAAIMAARLESISHFEGFVCKQYDRLAGGQERLRMQYLPCLVAKGVPHKAGLSDLPRESEGLKHLLEERLKAQRREEIRRGMTTIGPHRDEIRFFSNELDLGVYGSRGQVRTAVMALKIAETQWLKERTGELPVMLLDETMAELDETRRRDLLGDLGRDEQAILTTTDVSLFSKEFREACRLWRVEAGSLNPMVG